MLFVLLHTEHMAIKSLSRLGARTLGIDASASNIAIASLHASQDSTLRNSPLSYRNASAEDLVKETNRFDVVCSMEVIEHVDNPAIFLQSCASLVKVCYPNSLAATG